ncbi:hypothetical protein HPB51_003364 [Rhipicephalus microplus]|uniref:Uncharacterized protein n=1 Tax=Rhipicephalus microplus TaxID=6941 RepID=A0A9J6D3U1_RHIMP|nr:hypothetical protein HPB51_003364 [Rhipicephalus microplus]
MRLSVNAHAANFLLFDNAQDKSPANSNDSERALYKWVAEHDEHGDVLSPKTLSRGGRARDREQLLDNFGLGVLRRVMPGFHKQQEIPTVCKLTAYFKEDDSLSSVSTTTVHRMLLKSGFSNRREHEQREAYFIFRFRTLVAGINEDPGKLNCLREVSQEKIGDKD